MTASGAFVGNTVTLTLVDGSPNDGDGTLDGVIVDPGGAALAGVPTTDPGDGGGSGTPDTTATTAPTAPAVTSAPVPDATTATAPVLTVIPMFTG